MIFENYNPEVQELTPKDKLPKVDSSAKSILNF